MSPLTPAVLKDTALRADILAANDGPDAFRVWWLGQSGFLLKWLDNYLLFDPYLSDSLTEKYAATAKPHVRLGERVIAPDLLDMVHFATASHLHTDHLDAATLLPIARASTHLRLILPASLTDAATDRLGPDARITFATLDDGTSTGCGPFHCTGIAAAHNSIERDALGQCRFLSFLVRFGPFTIWHSGDTLWHDALPAALIAARPDVVFVPINGNDPSRGVAGNLNGTEAAALAKACGARLAIPHHFGMFAFNTASPDEFTAACSRLNQPFLVLGGGESFVFRQSPAAPA